MKRATQMVAALVGGVVALALSAPLEATEFYQGKRLTILSHSAPGGYYDLLARMLAMHIGKHIPGNPRILVQNMPGGGGHIQANYLFRVARPDGLTIGIIAPGAAYSGALRLPEAEFRSDRFQWIGLVTQGGQAIYSRKDAPIRTIENLLDPEKRPLIIGTQSPPSILYSIPHALNLLLEKVVGRPLFRIITGYRGTAETAAAMERGEIEGFLTTYETIKAVMPHYFEPAPGKGFVNIIGYVSVVKDRELENVGAPFMPDLVKNPRDRAVLNLVLAPTRLRGAVAAPPDIPSDRLGVLRKAFMAVVSDQQFLADMQKRGLTTEPLPGEELQGYLKSLAEMPQEVAQSAKAIFGR